MAEYRLKYKIAVDLQLFAQEKTERATPRKRQKARSRGQVAKSMEIPGAFILLFTFVFLVFAGGYFEDRMYRLFTVSFNEYMLWELSADNVAVIFSNLIYRGFILLLPIMAISVIVAVLANYLQFGLLFTAYPLKPQISKLNPVHGAKRLFSLRSVVELLKSVLKLMIVGTVVYWTLFGEKESLPGLWNLPVESIFRYTASLTLELGVKVGLLLIVLALLDYMYQRYQHEKSLRMSKQDIKDEHKNVEGDPLVKSRIRERQRRFALQRMMQEVPKADVVITNPTHYAVALRYDASEMEAPKVVAKGQDYIALKIKEIAAEHGVVTMENKPLARALYERVEIGETVPADLFQAVAEVLAYVYRIKRKA